MLLVFLVHLLLLLLLHWLLPSCRQASSYAAQHCSSSCTYRILLIPLLHCASMLLLLHQRHVCLQLLHLLLQGLHFARLLIQLVDLLLQHLLQLPQLLHSLSAACVLPLRQPALLD
jgi:hypothetical protein